MEHWAYDNVRAVRAVLMAVVHSHLVPDIRIHTDQGVAVRAAAWENTL